MKRIVTIATMGLLLGILYPALNTANVGANPHGPITILSNSDFTSANGVVSGTGTSWDPYVISGWEIFGGDFGVRVANTDRFFIITDNSILNSTYCGISVNSAANNTCEIRNNVIRYAQIDGILIEQTNQSKIQANDVQFCVSSGIVIRRSHNCRIEGNLANSNSQKTGGGAAGIYIDESTLNAVVGNIANSNSPLFAPGLWLIHNSSFNTMYFNEFSLNCHGILIDGESKGSFLHANSMLFNTLSGIVLAASSGEGMFFNNTIAGNSRGVDIINSSSNRFWVNNFVYNTLQVVTDSSINLWDNSYPCGGNHWSDYTGTDTKSGPSQNEPCKDGIGDNHNVINLNNVDYYPLMNLWPQDLLVVSSTPTSPAPFVPLDPDQMVRETEPINVKIIIKWNPTDVQKVLFFYRVNGEPWCNTTAIYNPTSRIWTRNIPGQPSESVVEFYAEIYIGADESPTCVSDIMIRNVKSLIDGDINGDGIVDIFDIVIVAIHFGETG